MIKWALLTIKSDNHGIIIWGPSTQHQHRFLRLWFRCRGCKRSCWSDCRRDIFTFVWVACTSTRAIFLNNVLESIEVFHYLITIELIQNYYTNLTWTICSATLKLSNTCIFAMTVIFTIVNASCQRHSIDIETFIPVRIFSNILIDSVLMMVEIIDELTKHSQIEFAQPSQPVGQSMSHGQPYWNFKM